ncbi:MAG: hypothetical protein PHV23_00700 [Candidatus Gracilibacteria bacterium]|nr:hypothetical protein [Candidatus Gracilibacteria bacterium]
MQNEFLVLAGTRVSLEGRTVMASGDFLVSFDGKLLNYINHVRSGVKHLVDNGEFSGYFVDCTTEYGIATINIADLLTMH